MDVTQLRTIVQIARVGSLNKASDELHTAQPALSRQVRLLEEELGVQLFVRHGRGMLPTAIGARVIERAKGILGEIEDIRDEVRTYLGRPEGRIVLGMPPTVGEMITIPLTRALQKAHPFLSFRYTAGMGGHLLEWLHRGDLDMAVVYTPHPLKSVVAEPLMEETLVAVGGAERGFRMDIPVRLSDLRSDAVVLPGPKHHLRSLIDSMAEEARVTLGPRFEVEGLVTIRDAVASGLGITFLPMSYVGKDVAAGRLTAAPVIEPVIRRSLSLARLSSKEPTKEFRAVEDTLRTLIADLIACGDWPNAKVPEPA